MQTTNSMPIRIPLVSIVKVFFLIWFGLVCTKTQAQEISSASQLEQYKQKAAEYEQSESPNDACFYNTKIGYYYWQQGQSTEAITYLQKAIVQAQKLGNINGIAELYNSIGSIYLDDSQYAKAYENFSKALEYRKKQKDKRKTLEQLYNASEALLNLNRNSDAIAMLEEANKIALEINEKNILRTSFNRLAEAYAKAGNISKQQEYFDLFKSLDKELQKELLAKKDAEANQKIGAIQTEATKELSKKNQIIQKTSEELEKERQISRERMLEIDLLNSQNEVQRLTLADQANKLKLQQVINWSLFAGLGLLTLLLVTITRSYFQKKKANQVISMQKADLEAKNKELTELNNEKNYIIGIVAHDLKSPLNSIKGIIDILNMTKEAQDAQQAQMIDIVQRTVERMRGMISRILDVNAIETKELKLNIQPVDVAKVINSLAEERREVAKNKQINIITQIDAKRTIANLDEEYYYQVIENLLSNALKFSPFQKNVYLEVSQKENMLKVSVSDEGPGIKKAEQANLFKKFQRLSAQPTNGESSTGLGLSIVKRYVDAMHGHIFYEEKPGRGACFSIEFPIHNN